MGRYSVQFKCHRTLHCCTDVVCLPTPWDVMQLVKATGKRPLEFLEFLTPDEIDGVDEDDATWLEAGGERYLMALQRDSVAGCVFLDREARACSVYEARPILCRLYPFKLYETRDGEFNGFGLHKDVGCPRHRDGSVDTQPLYELYSEDCDHQQAYEHLVKTFNRRRDPDKRPEDFIGLFLG
jgi:Fe-S-cluster containining protein